MALTSFASIYSGLDTPISGTSQTETHRIPLTAPYEVLLSRIPRCAATAASVVENAFTTIAALRGECSLTINGAAATIIESQTPTASGQVAMQIVAGGAYEFSPKVTFHSSDAGKTAVFTYFGFMSNADSRYITTLQQAVQRVEDVPPCAILSSGTYDSGTFGRGSADSTSVYVTALRGSVASGSSHLTFSGATANLSTDADIQVAAFSDTDAYKTISLYLRDISGVLMLRTAESAEVASAPTTPTITYADGWLCGAVIVQGDGTGSVGGILPITQANCVSLWDMGIQSLIWDNIDDKPTEFPAEAHEHVVADITDMPTTFPAATHEHVIADLSDWPTTFPPETHSHDLSVLPETVKIGSTYLTGNVAGALMMSDDGVSGYDLSREGHLHNSEMAGMTVIFPAGQDPPYWEQCDGRAISRTTPQGENLVALSCPFGVGDGTTTVNLPTLAAPSGFTYYMFIGYSA